MRKNSSQKQKSGQIKGNFEIKSFSALLDYLRFAPQSVKELKVSPKFVTNLFNSLSQEQVSRISYEVHEGLGTDFRAIVEIALGDEASMLTSLSHSNGVDSKAILVLVLCHLQDPRNFGSVIRTCGFYGVDYVIIPKNRQVLLTDAVVATAQGGFASTSVAVVTNLSRCLKSLKSLGFWVAGLDVKGEPLDSLQWCSQKTALVVGNESHGIDEGVLQSCDYKVSITGSEKSLDSLNVGVSAGIAIDYYYRMAKKNVSI